MITGVLFGNSCPLSQARMLAEVFVNLPAKPLLGIPPRVIRQLFVVKNELWVQLGEWGASTAFARCLRHTRIPLRLGSRLRSEYTAMRPADQVAERLWVLTIIGRVFPP